MAEDNMDDITKNFSGWNPMKDDYLNSEFNLYDSGPGANMDPTLQLPKLVKQKSVDNTKSNRDKSPNDSVTPYLVFKNLPKGMTEKSIVNLCQRYGNVKSCRSNKKFQNVFVDLCSTADMEAIYRKLENNKFGFHISIGRKVLKEKKTIPNVYPSGSDKFTDNLGSSTHSSSYIDADRRALIISEKKPLRPDLKKLNDSNFEVADAKNSSLASNDPLCHHLKEEDSHAMERAGLSKPFISIVAEDEYDYRTGRAYKKMSEKNKAYLKDKHEKSKGAYNSKNGEYCNKFDNTLESRIYRCLVCNVPANISCFRCSPKLFIYCGLQCQNSDWEEHRKICGKDNFSDDEFFNNSLNDHNNSKDSEKLNQSSSSISSPSSSAMPKVFPKPDMPATNSIVTLTSISQPNIVFIRSKTDEKELKFFETITKIQSAVKMPLKELPSCGKAVIAKFPNSDEYGRALVLKAINEKNITINFLDYGNTEIVELSNLYKASSELIALPRFAIPVMLKGIPKHYMMDTVRQFMYLYLCEIDLVVKFDILDDLLPVTNIYQVDLYDAITNQHLNKAILELCKPQEPQNSNEILTMHDLTFKDLPVGKDIELFVMDNSQINIGCISATTRVFALEIKEFFEDIQHYANNLPPSCYAPCVNELCIAKYDVDGMWYRGRCLEKIGDGKPTIHFIDYGNIAYVKVQDIHPYPPKFSWPIYTIDFNIEGLPEVLNQELFTRLEMMYSAGDIISCDLVEKIDNNFYNLTMKKTIETLKDEGLLN